MLVLFYGRLILYAANWLSDGSEMLLEILNPGLIGGTEPNRHLFVMLAHGHFS